MTQNALAETDFFDLSSTEVSNFIKKHVKSPARDKRRQAVELFYAVRDTLFYEIYNADFAREKMTASAIIQKKSGMCIHKSIVYVTLLRAIDIPARLWFTDVKNHLCSPQLKNIMGGNIFHYHCLVSLKLEGKWIKATPVFNGRLCQLYKMTSLEFDGYSDCVQHAYDEHGRQYMEILNDHGEFDDVPYDFILDGMHEKHATLFETDTKFKSGSLLKDAQTA